ncbi:hypothetical protein BA895_21950 [Humibacillus sp. DSM 29435]|uniref:DsbA family oxidoreductase n=1 Tax=Humibacillus sp. DSM 29435 TaxID=1869167 RepID=UPI000871FF49|nr:hypothetical protein [Humibacillus sp. DSM 29435]OFE15633.1 hypothetical protein BA895_21950 [Humibacillus sp. DSM 29435]
MIIYGDFTCPMCYLASWRADLLDGTADAVDWRAVEHQPTVPLTGLRPARAELEGLSGRWATMSSLRMPGEAVPGRSPSFVASTQAAVAGYAEAYGAGVAEPARRALFRAYWVGGLDIGNPEVLRGLLGDIIRSGHSSSRPLHEWGYAVTSARGPVTTAAFLLIRDWREQWSELGSPREPLLVDADGSTTTGGDVLARLEGQISGRPTDRHELPALAPRPLAGRFWT